MGVSQMRRHLPLTTRCAGCVMQHLHTEEQEQTAMDATTAIRTTICATAMIITLQSCTTSNPGTASQQPEFHGYDNHTAAAEALQKLEIFLQSIPTTTSTIIPKQPATGSSIAAIPQNRNDHADVWDQLAQCETGGNWGTNTGNGFGGGLQFAHQPSWSTWNAFGGGEFAPHPWEATREQQIEIAERVLQSSGWGAWPGCARKMGLL